LAGIYAARLALIRRIVTKIDAKNTHTWAHRSPKTHLLRAVFEKLERSSLGQAVELFDDTSRDEHAFEVAESSKGGGVDGQRLVRGGKGLRLLSPREQVSTLAPNSEPCTRKESDDTTKPRETGEGIRKN
jgi:hypothetical protein